MPNFKENTSPAMKRSGFKMSGYSYPGVSPVKNTKTELTNEQRRKNLLKVVPNEDAFNELSKEDQKGFTKAWIDSKGATKQVKEKKAPPVKNYKKGYYGA